MSDARASVRIIGIDPGSRVTGYGVVDFLGNRVVHVASGCIRPGGEALAERLCAIFEGVGGLVESEAPLEMAIEKVFVSRNAASALKLGQARGAALLAGAVRGLAVHEYSPNEVKQAITGRGHAEKQQVQHMVRVLLNLAETPVTDAADALAVAICHGHVRETRQRVRAGTGVAR
jgi:crossover junction endodeoxyribonuclease RuvC